MIIENKKGLINCIYASGTQFSAQLEALLEAGTNIVTETPNINQDMLRLLSEVRRSSVGCPIVTWLCRLKPILNPEKSTGK